MNPTPPGWPRISAALYYDEAGKAIDWLCSAFGFEVRLAVRDEKGRIQHSELVFGDELVMVADASITEKGSWRKSPRALQGANTQGLMLYVDDVDAHCARARAAGAVIVSEPKDTDYGDDYWADRGYACVDPEGHHWWFAQRLRTGRG